MLGIELTKVKWNPSVHAFGKFVVHITGNSQIHSQKKIFDDIALIVHSADPPFTEICRTISHKVPDFDAIMIPHDRRTFDTEEIVAVMYQKRYADETPCQMLKLPLVAQKKNISESQPVPITFDRDH